MHLTVNIDLDKTRGGLPDTSRSIVADALHQLAEELEGGMELDGAGNVDAPSFGETIGFWEVAP